MQPVFIPTQFGDLFAVLFNPDHKTDRVMLHIPAFAEEMNNARQMVAQQAHAFAAQGYPVLILDLSGTGDSNGEFAEASWEIWLHNLESAMDWLNQQGYQKIAFWSLRTGVLLALAFIARSQRQITHLLCWQPVWNAETFLNQLLRIRVATAMLAGNDKRQNRADLKQQLFNGQGLEVAGYWLNPDLIKPLLAVKPNASDLKALTEIAVFEVVPAMQNPVTTSTENLLDEWPQSTVKRSIHKVTGNYFWANPDDSVIPELIDLSSQKAKSWLTD
jgi:exosortase A-associated hydrolase 2